MSAWGAPAPAPRAPPQSAETPGEDAYDDYAHLVQQAIHAASAVDGALEPIREQDRLLPAANVFRIIQRELPEGSKISRDAKYFMQVWQFAYDPHRAKKVELHALRVAHWRTQWRRLCLLLRPKFALISRPRPNRRRR
jgi:hypothetical protein